MKKNRNFYLISLCSLSAFLALQFFDPQYVNDHLESKTYDLRLQLRNFVVEQPKADDIVLVMIDEKSIAKIGRWPWSRKVQAQLVDRISSGRPKVLGIDIMYSERENAENDGALARALKNAGNVVLATAFILPEPGAVSGKPGAAPDFLWDSAFMEVKAVPGIDWRAWAVKPNSVNPPLAELAGGAALGHVTKPPDLDGVLRWETLSVNFGEDCYPSLPLQVARIACGLPMKEMTLVGGAGIKLGNRFIGTDLSGRALVNYLGKEKSFPYLSAGDLMSGEVSPEILNNKVVLLGTSALATYDQKVTPFSADMPGVENNANVVHNILRNNFISKSPGIAELVSILAGSLFLMLLLPRLKAAKGIMFGGGLIVFYFLISCVLLIYFNLWINLLYPAMNMLVIVATQTTTKLFMEEKRAKEIRALFSSYVSPKIVETLINNPEKARLGGERRVATILFSDMIGFTTLSERLPPEEVVAMLNEYYKEMAEIIFHWDGTLDKFVGDEIMALWGAPLDQPDHAERAVRCALHMSDRLNEMQQMWREQGRSIVDCGIGLNTGEVLIGNIGLPGKKMDYTAIGNHVNIAARVEKLTREYQSRILITDATYAEIAGLIESGSIGHVEVRELDAVKVKGKDEEVKIIAITSLKNEAEEGAERVLA
jgi:adenylate cyclase